MELAVCNTFYRKSRNHLVTYASGNSRSQIDYVMVRRADRRMVSNVKAIAGVECVQQHRLVIADLAIGKVKKNKKPFVPRLKLWKLNTTEGRERFQAGKQEKIEEINSASSTEEN